MSPERLVQEFVLAYLNEIEAATTEGQSIYRAVFPPGRKRRFGGERSFTFDPSKRQPKIELIEPGSPLLKLLLLDAKQWGGAGACATSEHPTDTLLYTFQFEAYSSVQKRTEFVHAVLPPDATEPRVENGVPHALLASHPRGDGERLDLARAQNALPMVLRPVEAAARRFAETAVRESHEGFEKSIGRVKQYFEGMKHETFLEEARIRKRLGEIQSKLYFTEDGLRELKLQREQEKLTEELHNLKQRNTQAEDTISKNELDQLEKQRRRHEPKLRIRLVAVTVVTRPGPQEPPGPPPSTDGTAVPVAATAAAL